MVKTSNDVDTRSFGETCSGTDVLSATVTRCGKQLREGSVRCCEAFFDAQLGSVQVSVVANAGRDRRIVFEIPRSREVSVKQVHLLRLVEGVRCEDSIV